MQQLTENATRKLSAGENFFCCCPLPNKYVSSFLERRKCYQTMVEEKAMSSSIFLRYKTYVHFGIEGNEIFIVLQDQYQKMSLSVISALRLNI